MRGANPRSTARIAGHPLHPMLIPFPIAFFVAAFVCDLAFWRTDELFWVLAAQWLLGAGLIMAALAAVAGLIDFLGDARIRAYRAAWHHMIGNVVAVLLELLNFWLRYNDGADVVVPTGLIISTVVVGLLLFTGWKGGTLVYEHRVAVLDELEVPGERRD